MLHAGGTAFDPGHGPLDHEEYGSSLGRPGSLHTIERLAAHFRPNERNLALYFPDFSMPPPAGCLHRVFGPPVGVTDEDWPRYPRLGELLHRGGAADQWDPHDPRMEHVFTIDLRDIRLPGAPPEAVAMSLFISNASHHHAHQNGNADTVVLFLGEEQLRRGVYRGELPRRSQTRWSRRFSLRRIDVPGDVFDPHDDPDSTIALLQDAIWQTPARLGGCPMWVREPIDPLDQPPPLRPPRKRRPGPRGRDTFLMQFERRFADVHLGHHGIMYVSGNGAYYQSY